MSLTMPNEEESQTPIPILHDDSLPWILSSQTAADLYAAGAPLWRREDLRDIERQLSEYRTRQYFTVRRIDGTVLNIGNPVHGVPNPIWKPSIRFQHYWHLVKTEPRGHRDTYNCTYLVDWVNHAGQEYHGPLDGYDAAFREKRELWDGSATCKLLKAHVRDVLATSGNPRVTKVVCFGMGDLTTRPPTWWRTRNRELEQPARETEMIEFSVTQYCAALTVADAVREHQAGTGGDGAAPARLLTQDPSYTDLTRALLGAVGFEVTGASGASGFAEVDHETVVFSAFTTAPVKQIVADLTRPVLFISSFPLEIFTLQMKPEPDAESPRTREMWNEYTMADFPVAAEEVPLMASMHRLKIAVRTARTQSDGAT